MPIVAIPQGIEQRTADSLLVTGVLTDNASFKQPFDVVFVGPTTAEQARQRLAALLTSNQSQDELKKALQIGVPFDLTPPVPVPPDPPPPPDPPTQDELDRVAFLESYSQLQSALRKVAAGVIAADDVDLKALETATQALYKSAYLGIG